VENDAPREPEIAKIAEMIRDVEIAMLTTVSEDGSLRSRPMATQRHAFDGTLRFFVPASGALAADVRRTPRIAVSYAEPKEERYVSISGNARVVRDPVRIAQLWHPMLERWFPKGQADPDLALLEVEAESADAWDGRKGTLARVYEKLRAVTSGEMPGAPGRDRVDFVRR
jgi:general stress protein 26